MGRFSRDAKALFGLIPLFLFIGLPIAEIAVFIAVGGAIGVWPTLGLVLLAAVAGVSLIRVQGLRTLWSARNALERRRIPIVEAFDALCIVLGGILLVIPGFITDAVALVLLLPPIRALVRTPLLRRVAVYGFTATGGRPPPGGSGGPIIEGDYSEVDPDVPPARRRLGSDRG